MNFNSKQTKALSENYLKLSKQFSDLSKTLAEVEKLMGVSLTSITTETKKKSVKKKNAVVVRQTNSSSDLTKGLNALLEQGKEIMSKI